MSNIESAWQALNNQAQTTDKLNLSALFDGSDRANDYSISVDGLFLDFSKHLVTDDTLRCLLSLAEHCQIIDKATAMANGELINRSENRAALHMAMRQPSTNLDDALQQQFAIDQQQLLALSTQIRDGLWQSDAGETFTDVINIGIGGADLGPKMVVEALREFNDGPTVHFLSNIDGAEVNSLTQSLNPATTLLIISSKSFSTQETLQNTQTALDWLSSSLGIANVPSSRHCIAVTNNPQRALEFGFADDNVLTFNDAIGGRYSLWSSVGLGIAISIGSEQFMELLAGGAEMDEHFLNAPPSKNMPLMLGLLSVWYNNFLNAQSQAVVPYCQRLNLFVDHLQQLDMESSGKSASVDNQTINIDSGAIIWGQTGTHGQHSFFQLLHQGTKLVPVDFIGVIKDNLSIDTHHRTLLANMLAQSQALMNGNKSAEPYNDYPGNRPSSTILLDELNPNNLGKLIALYEHKVFTQCMIWNINPFDQWGVELGKQLTSDLLNQSNDGLDPSTRALMKRTGL